MKRNLVFCSTASLATCRPQLFGQERNFDVCVHFYEQQAVPHYEEGELVMWSNLGPPLTSGIWHYYQPGEKLNVAGKLFAETGWLKQYERFAFLDDDLEISTDQINRLFRVGEALRLPLYQPALTVGSVAGWPFLKQQAANGVRKVPMVEVMCPFFSRAALEKCLETFDLNLSSWGLDLYVWLKTVDGECYALDGIPIGHYREATRRTRVLANGLTPFQELWIMKKIYGPIEDTSYPPRFVPGTLKSLQEI